MLYCSASLAMSTSVLKALPGKLDVKRHSPSILYVPNFSGIHTCVCDTTVATNAACGYSSAWFIRYLCFSDASAMKRKLSSEIEKLVKERLKRETADLKMQSVYRLKSDITRQCQQDGVNTSDESRRFRAIQ